MASYQFSHREVYDEIRRMTGEDRYSPAYIGQVRSGYVRSDEVEKLVAQALNNLQASNPAQAA